MRASFIIISLTLIICAACVVTIFWGLDPDLFGELDEKFDISDAVMSCVVIYLLASMPSRLEH